MPNPKKRKRSYYQALAKKSKYEFRLSAGIKGFLCTYNGHPKFCIREVYNILDEFAQTSQDDAQPGECGDDFEEQLKKDIENIQYESKHKEFQVVETGVTGCVFIKTASANPSAIMEIILQKIIDSGTCQTRKLLRMLPIPVTCKAYIEDIKKAVGSLFDEHFKVKDPRTYAIIVNRRNNNNVPRDELIQTLGLMIRDRNPFHSANLKDPQLTVLVEILRNVCCLTVLPDYNKKRKYNLLQLGYSTQTEKGEETEDVCNSSNDEILSKTENDESVKTGNTSPDLVDDPEVITDKIYDSPIDTKKSENIKEIKLIDNIQKPVVENE